MTTKGLTSLQAQSLLALHGPNQIEKKTQASALHILFSQFTSPLILILLVASGVTFFLGDYVDTWVILAAVFLNTILGFYQEYRAQRGLEALSMMLSPQARVLRDGEYVTLPTSVLVPGDLVSVSAGETVGADGVLLEAHHLMLNEAILTGESLLVAKTALRSRDTLKSQFVSIRDRDEESGRETVYMGTTVASGSALMQVVHTGGKTEIGSIATQLSETIDGDTPLQIRLKKLGGFLTVTVLLVASLIFLIGILKGSTFDEMFTLSVAVAVSAIPEGLAVSLTAILAIGMQRILKKKALVRKLLAAEVLGSVTVICSDKTGTLTEGVMRVTYAESIDDQKLLLAASMGNSLTDPIEVGMWEWAKATIDKAFLQKFSCTTFAELVDAHQLVDQLPFDPDLRYAAKMFAQDLFVLGAPETILSFSVLTQREKEKWQQKVVELASRGLRVIAFGYTKAPDSGKITRKNATTKITFLGILAYEDPIRKGVASALQKAKKAGVLVKVITGDFRETARGVMRQLKWEIDDAQIIEGEALERMSEHELRRKVHDIVLFARTTPSQKLKIVNALQARGEVVAMTGDGVNDAPALKKSDIGIVVASASDVSKETADVVLLDSNFSTIISTIEEGRGIFENLRKVLLYLLSDSFAEVLLVLLAVLLGIPTPITAAQILWINLVDDGLPNLALTLDPKDPDLLSRKPRGKNEPIIDSEIKVLVSLISLVTASLVFGVFWWYLESHGLSYARTMAFAMLAVDSLLYVFSSRSLRRPIWKDGFFKNRFLVGAVCIGFVVQLVAMYVPFFQMIFDTVSLNAFDWVVVGLSALVVMVVIEGVKWLFLHPFQKESVAPQLNK